ncbi:leucine-rich repeat-containing protein kinase family protein [Comamonas terrigena]|uniref:Protein kinase domain-containing protein n=1 Tax=Comamonas terrigena TaxID=32013 RepID=A0A2A7UXJ6_COMTR|nr:leucine-rich repeat-containing protein kinase family protein [Comamonas terrigena]PEH89978.1 hypothetical protein CRM82_16505 [Comamonas terrigena]BBL25250.1 hypothetical protein CT3_27050 [Comamonas terrigena NBRC 13299]SUY71169.1 E3 ubiquitin-protein ligase sspH2 [Comamonas terrigena]
MHTLDQLESGALAGAREVRLCNQGLTAIPPALFALADTLELLDLSGNQLSSLPAEFARFARLRVLFASHNPFTELPSVLGQLPELEMVGFRACRIAEVPPHSLPARLRWLILTDNCLTSVPDALGERPRLQKLMLSCNQLTALPASLVRCNRLELLRMASNRFTAVPEVLLQLPQLAWPALAGNPLTQASEQQLHAAAAAKALPFADLEVGALLGEGASGHIYRARNTRSGTELALKIFKAAHTSDGTPQSELAAGMAVTHHPQLLTPLAAVSGLPQGQLAMALPLLPEGMQPLAGPPSLRSCTRDVYAPGVSLSSCAAQHILAQISGAVRHLHYSGVLHGDLYAHNILWNPQTGAAMLSDLGAALLTRGLPTAQVRALQQIELRALHILRDELYAVAR